MEARGGGGAVRGLLDARGEGRGELSGRDSDETTKRAGIAGTAGTADDDVNNAVLPVAADAVAAEGDEERLRPRESRRGSDRERCFLVAMAEELAALEVGKASFNLAVFGAESEPRRRVWVSDTCASKKTSLSSSDSALLAGIMNDIGGVNRARPECLRGGRSVV